jgi:hypothetical protein
VEAKVTETAETELVNFSLYIEAGDYCPRVKVIKAPLAEPADKAGFDQTIYMRSDRGLVQAVFIRGEVDNDTIRLRLIVNPRHAVTLASNNNELLIVCKPVAPH